MCLLPTDYDRCSPTSILEASFSSDSCPSASLDGSLGMKTITLMLFYKPKSKKSPIILILFMSIISRLKYTLGIFNQYIVRALPVT